MTTGISERWTTPAVLTLSSKFIRDSRHSNKNGQAGKEVVRTNSPNQLQIYSCSWMGANRPDCSGAYRAESDSTISQAVDALLGQVGGNDRYLDFDRNVTGSWADWPLLFVAHCGYTYPLWIYFVKLKRGLLTIFWLVNRAYLGNCICL